MARTKTTLPAWWTFVILAAFTFIGLHELAAMAPDPGGPSTAAHLGTVVGRSLLIAGSKLLQYVLPILLLLVAAISAFNGKRRR